MHFAEWLTLGVTAILVGLTMYGRVAAWKKYTTPKTRKTDRNVPL